MRRVTGIEVGSGFALECWWRRRAPAPWHSSAASQGGGGGGRGETAVGSGIVELKEVAIEILRDESIVGQRNRHRFRLR